MATLLELRTNVRNHLDFEAEEFTDAELNHFANEATNHIHSWANWSWLRTRTDVTVPTGAKQVAMSSILSGTLGKVLSIESPTHQLHEVSADEIRRWHLQDSSGKPTHYAVDRLADSQLLLWPQPEAEVVLTIEGKLKPARWATSDAATPDVDDGLEFAIEHWMLYRAYSQLGDGLKSQHHMDMAQQQIELQDVEDRANRSTTAMVIGGGERDQVPVRTMRKGYRRVRNQPYRLVD